LWRKARDFEGDGELIGCENMVARASAVRAPRRRRSQKGGGNMFTPGTRCNRAGTWRA
jgi:hypothetical protein